MNESIILIGPMGVGKSSIAYELSKKYSMEVLSADTLEEEYAKEKDIDRSVFAKLLETHGIDGVYPYWEEFTTDFVINLLLKVNRLDKPVIVDFGGLHTSIFNSDNISRIQQALEPFPNVIYLKPAQHLNDALRILDDRRYDNKLKQLNRKAMRATSNKTFAKKTVVTGNRKEEDITREIVRFIARTKAIKYLKNIKLLFNRPKQNSKENDSEKVM